MDDLAKRIFEEQERERVEREAWDFGDYEPFPCPNCSRMRLCKCPNGKHRCEKCNWCPEDQFYAPISNR